MKNPPKWTGDAVKKKHLYNIKDAEIAEMIGKSRELVSRTLNGSYTFNDDKQIIMEAIERLINIKLGV